MALPIRRQQVVRWVRSRPLAPRYRSPAVALRLRAVDGTRLAATRLAGPDDAPVSIVVVHGFSNSSRSLEIHRLAVALSSWAHVVALDLRGHGRSGGRCTLGVKEPWDVAAAVSAARAFAPDTPVVVLGVSLGGVSGLLAAGRGSPVAGVISVSAPAWLDLSSPAGVRLSQWAQTRRGRALLHGLSGARVDPVTGPPERVEDAVASVSPGFVVIAHDPRRAGVRTGARAGSVRLGVGAQGALVGAGRGTRAVHADARAGRADAGRDQRAAEVNPDRAADGGAG